MSVASVTPTPQQYLDQLKVLVDEIEPFVVSDHLCWTRGSAHNTHDLMPFPFVQESLDAVCHNVELAQDTLGRTMALENISAYLAFGDDTMTEQEFLKAICDRTGCGLLLDVNNVFVNATNYKFDPFDYLDAYPTEHVVQLHIAGHTDMGNFLFDTHSRPVREEVWALLKHVDPMINHQPILLEWDDDIPSFEDVEAEALKARHYLANAG